MNKWLVGAALTAALTMGAAGTSSAATLVAATGTPLTYAVHNPGGQPDGAQLTEDTNPGGYLVDFTSTGVLHDNGNSGGFATVTGAGGIGGSGYADLTIDPEDPLAGFTAIKFNLILPANPLAPGGGTTFDWNTRVYFLGGGFQDFLDTAASPPERYIVADPGQVMTKIVFSALDADYDTGNGQNVVHNTEVPFNFDGIEQVSFDGAFAAVPEPGTWAMMLIGVFGVGAMLRRRQAMATA